MRALMKAAEHEPLGFHVTMYCGQLIVTGRVAPSAWWYEVTKRGYWEELGVALRKVRKEDEKRAQMETLYAPIAADLSRAQPSEGEAGDEVTLVDVSIFPAVSTQGTQSGGHTLPVARVPLASIDVWWIVSGDSIRGSGGSNIGWGFLFPVGN